jgi:hypothetical protein
MKIVGKIQDKVGDFPAADMKFDVTAEVVVAIFEGRIVLYAESGKMELSKCRKPDTYYLPRKDEEEKTRSEEEEALLVLQTTIDRLQSGIAANRKKRETAYKGQITNYFGDVVGNTTNLYNTTPEAVKLPIIAPPETPNVSMPIGTAEKDDDGEEFEVGSNESVIPKKRTRKKKAIEPPALVDSAPDQPAGGNP